MPISLPKIKLNNPFGDISPEDQKVLLICLGIAFVFWILVKLSKEYTVHRVVNIKYELPLKQTFRSQPPQQVGVDLVAKGWYFLRSSIVGRELSVEYTVPEQEKYEVSSYQLHGDIDKILKDKKVTIAQLYFQDFEVYLEEQTVKRLPIFIPLDIEFADDYALAEPWQLTPDSVTVSGPISRLDTLTQWPTDSLTLSKVDQNYKGVVGLKRPEGGMKLTLENVNLAFNVERFTEKNIFVSVQLEHTFTDSIRFFPDKVLLKCIIGLGHYDELTAADFVLRAELNESLISQGKSTAALQLTKQPSHVRSVHFFPKVVEFLVIKK